MLMGSLLRNVKERLNFLLTVYRWKKSLKNAFVYDLAQYYRFSEQKTGKSKDNLIGIIIRRYHSIEKGLTMCDRKLGFGQKNLIPLINDCILYIEKYGIDDDQLVQALSVIKEYRDLHRVSQYPLEGATNNSLSKLEKFFNVLLDSTDIVKHQKEFEVDRYFDNVNNSFYHFSQSRMSIRNYSKADVKIECIQNALDLARFAPSACNRQSWRTYVFTDKNKINEILTLQGGNRGFGHLANKLLLITSERGLFAGASERNQAFIDGGIYAMNLLYSLHYYKIGACILNCSNSVEKDRKLRNLCQVKDSEVFIAFVACGIPPEKFEVTASVRYRVSKTNKFIFD